MTHPLRILLDARMLIGTFSGVGRVVTSLVDELTHQPDVRIVALCGEELYPPWTHRTDIELIRSNFRRADRSATRRLWWEERHLPRLIAAAGVDLYHATWNSGVPAHCPVPAVLTVHDLIPWHEPRRHFATRLQWWCHRHAVRASARRAAAVTTVTNYVRDEVIGTLRLDPAHVFAVPNGVSPPAPVSGPPLPCDRPYVLYVGGHEPRKNIAALFRALHAYWRRHRATLELHVTGSPRTLPADARAEFARLPQRTAVRFLGHLDDRQLAGEYRRAAALLLLSLDEGFGLPVVEAMAHGCPVIAANRASLPEVVGDAGLLVDPDAAEDAADALHRLVSDIALRRQYIAAGRARAALYTWRRSANTLLPVYQRALATASEAPAPEAARVMDPAALGKPAPSAAQPTL
ncbi:MAG TPA: glycosyltransferase family 1 protein [Phycisphaerae bacterium]|nr:glycosyltransferase family 1 protein [Phycisphaerae bacterium]HNU45829.1 glycosyltransferase family 1 protein [Phycisphaerae bacterium]